MKKNKGITLVALVITIIILLILAGITISSLTNSGLFKKAKEAEQKQKNAQEEENAILDEYELKIKEIIDGTSETTQSTGETKSSEQNSPVENYEVTEVFKNASRIKVKSETASQNSDITCFVYLLNGEYIGTAKKGETIEIDNLKPDTKYNLISVAVDKLGNTKRNIKEIQTESKQELNFDEEFLNSGNTNGNVAYTSNNYNGTEGLKMTGNSTNPAGVKDLTKTNRWYKNIDLSKYDTLEFYIKKIVDHGSAFIYLNNKEIFAKPYGQLSSEWTKYTVDISEYKGENILSIIGGYTDSSGNSTSETQFCGIKLLNY